MFAPLYFIYNVLVKSKREDYHSELDGPSGLSFNCSELCFTFMIHRIFKVLNSSVFYKCCELTKLPLVRITGNSFELHGWNRISKAAMCMQKKKIIDPLMPSQRVHWWGKIKKPLNSAIANNEPSLLKLQQALIGFRVMKKTTWSIIIKAWCRHVRAWALCCVTGGAELHLQGPQLGHVLGATIHPPTSTSQKQQHLKRSLWF